jgi:hypothetical protein
VDIGTRIKITKKYSKIQFVAITTMAAVPSSLNQQILIMTRGITLSNIKRTADTRPTL